MLIEAEILHHYQSGFQGGLEAQPTRTFTYCGTGILWLSGRARSPTPTPHKKIYPIVEQASCGFQGGLEAQPLLPTRKFTDCGTGILPVLKNSSAETKISLANRRGDGESVLG